MISKSINQFTRHLKLVHFYFLIAWIVSFLIVFIVAKLDLVEQINQIKLLQYLVPIFCFLIILIGYLYFYQKIKLVRKEENLSFKLDEYGQAYINKIAFLIGLGLFVDIVYLLTQDNFHLIITGIIFILLMLESFSKKRMTDVLKMNNTEKDLLNDQSFNIVSKDRSYIQRNPWILIPMILFLLYLIYDGVNGLL